MSQATMLAFVLWTESSWSMAFSKSCRVSATRMRICNCRFSTRNTRQTVSGGEISCFVSLNSNVSNALFWMQAQHERGRVTRKFRHVHCERFWQDSSTSPVCHRGSFWLSCPATVKMRTRRSEWSFWQRSHLLTRIGDIISCLICLKFLTSSHRVDHQPLSS